MNKQFALTLLNRAYKDKSLKTRTSQVNTLDRCGIFEPHVFGSPQKVMEILRAKYSANYAIGFSGLLSRMFHVLTNEEKIALYNWSVESYPSFVKTPLLAQSDDKKLKTITNEVHQYYKNENHKHCAEINSRPALVMTPEYEEKRHMPEEVLVKTVLGKLAELREKIEKDKNRIDICEYGLLIGTLCYFCGDKMRRLDLALAKYRNHLEHTPNNLDACDYFPATHSFLIRRCNKVTKEKDVAIIINDRVVQEHLDYLVSLREELNQDYLFMKQRGQDRTPDCHWFGVAMKQNNSKHFGKDICLNQLRKIGVQTTIDYDDGDKDKQREMCAKFGHSYATRQNYYYMRKEKKEEKEEEVKDESVTNKMSVDFMLN
ncbi:uncharacterized protein EV422DRAFT_510350 [Fimicolochytrium jonesii]|uniref:uncharacterized protein n=1 Tax=Fimicolochytrium jonesii TaxID=1396493 RepID=UPI0022FDF426|nr:uncharacterized protein EV422DRAFT_510350 [Fimicolochytrium jonesii]KAI8815687.1 hypothetical protein EV422DRAFT_510350 [Fimicolochytrium jonesii]